MHPVSKKYAKKVNKPSFPKCWVFGSYHPGVEMSEHQNQL